MSVFQHEFSAILIENIFCKISVINKVHSIRNSLKVLVVKKVHSIISEHHNQYNKFSDIDKIFYSLFQQHIFDFHCNFISFIISYSLTDFSQMKVSLLQMHEISLSCIAFCNDCLADRNSFNKCVIDTFSDEHKFLNDVCANYIWNNNEISCFIDCFFHVFYVQFFLICFAASEFQSIFIEFVIFIIKSDKSFKKSDYKKFSWLKTLNSFFLFKHSTISQYKNILFSKNFWFISFFKNVNSDSMLKLQTVIKKSEHLTIFFKNCLAVISFCKYACFI